MKSTGLGWDLAPGGRQASSCQPSLNQARVVTDALQFVCDITGPAQRICTGLQVGLVWALSAILKHLFFHHLFILQLQNFQTFIYYRLTNQI